MALRRRNLHVDDGPPPPDVLAFLREAQRRIERFLNRSSHIPGFVPADYALTYRVLRSVAGDMPRAALFCEWGSGFGVVACLAAMLEFDVLGIEIEPELVQEARRLAQDFDVPAQFACASFVPRQAAEMLREIGDFSWLGTEEVAGADDLELATEDFNVIFAYPWPDEEDFTNKLFDRYAASGALLLTYHGGDEFRMFEKK